MTQTASRGKFIAVVDRLFVAFELGWKDWKLACGSGMGQKPWQVTIPARDVAALARAIGKAKKQLGLPDGFARSASSPWPENSSSPSGDTPTSTSSPTAPSSSPRTPEAATRDPSLKPELVAVARSRRRVSKVRPWVRWGACPSASSHRLNANRALGDRQILADTDRRSLEALRPRLKKEAASVRTPQDQNETHF